MQWSHLEACTRLVCSASQTVFAHGSYPNYLRLRLAFHQEDLRRYNDHDSWQIKMTATDSMRKASGSHGQAGGREWKAVVFDVDGTLYRLRPLQRAVQIHFLRGHWHRPRELWQVYRAVSSYRHAIDVLRGVPADGRDLKVRQIEI